MYMCNIDTSDLDPRLMYQWLYEKFRKWNSINSTLERICEAREGPSKRTWHYLWRAINSYLDNYHEDDNYDALVAGLQGGRVSAAPHQPTRSSANKSLSAYARQATPNFGNVMSAAGATDGTRQQKPRRRRARSASAAPAVSAAASIPF